MKPDSRLIQDEYACNQQLAIVERYETFLDYVYPILLGIPRKHAILRDAVQRAAFGQVELFVEAGKSRQLSRLYTADAGLGLLRFYLRFLAAPKRELISQNQHKTAAVHLAEVGKMLGAWIKTAREAAKKG
jgi:hypothetical protein